MKKILVLGGYGNFGKRIVEDLADIPEVEILIAGRSLGKGQSLVTDAGQYAAKLTALAFDLHTDQFIDVLKEHKPFIVIHTGGPFQGQSHRVPQLCAEYACHYIDLADDRRFVCDITELNDVAKTNNCLLVSGASSVPGLSSAVVSHYLPHFSEIQDIDIAIAPGNKAERGEATLRGILSYTGHPLTVFRNGQITQIYGWMSPRRVNFGDIVGTRHLANVDVPDLGLFPHAFKVKNSVRFQAGLELPWLHYLMVGMAALARIKLVKNWAPLTKPIFRISEFLKRFGSDRGGMRVTISGKSHENELQKLSWSLYADNGVGPYIPTLSTILIARKLISHELTITGAHPCMSLYTLDEMQPYFDKIDVYAKEKIEKSEEIQKSGAGN